MTIQQRDCVAWCRERRNAVAKPPGHAIAYDIPGAAAAVTVSADYIRKEIHAGRLAAKKVGRAYRIGARQLIEWFEQLEDALL